MSQLDYFTTPRLIEELASRADTAGHYEMLFGLFTDEQIIHELLRRVDLTGVDLQGTHDDGT